MHMKTVPCSFPFVGNNFLTRPRARKADILLIMDHIVTTLIVHNHTVWAGEVCYFKFEFTLLILFRKNIRWKCTLWNVFTKSLGITWYSFNKILLCYTSKCFCVIYLHVKKYIEKENFTGKTVLSIKVL